MGVSKKNKGQVMILTVLALGGTILGATAIAGTLMLYQMRQAGDLIKSSEAIYNADSGIECGLNSFFSDLKESTPTFTVDASCVNANTSVNFECENNSDNTCTNNATPTAVISIGSSGDVKRAFYISVQSTSTVLTIPN
jgi:hypothetical protein